MITRLCERLHHKNTMENYNPTIKATRIDGVCIFCAGKWKLWVLLLSRVIVLVERCFSRRWFGCVYLEERFVGKNCEENVE